MSAGALELVRSPLKALWICLLSDCFICFHRREQAISHSPFVTVGQDNSAVGIRATLSRLSELLRRADEPLWEHLVEKNKVRWCAAPLLYSLPARHCLGLLPTLTLCSARAAAPDESELLSA